MPLAHEQLRFGMAEQRCLGARFVPRYFHINLNRQFFFVNFGNVCHVVNAKSRSETAIPCKGIVRDKSGVDIRQIDRLVSECMRAVAKELDAAVTYE